MLCRTVPVSRFLLQLCFFKRDLKNPYINIFLYQLCIFGVIYWILTERSFKTFLYLFLIIFNSSFPLWFYYLALDYELNLVCFVHTRVLSLFLFKSMGELILISVCMVLTDKMSCCILFYFFLDLHSIITFKGQDSQLVKTPIGNVFFLVGQKVAIYQRFTVTLHACSLSLQ